jgi:hypothetical protein
MLCVSTTSHFHFIIKRLWLPSSIKLISFKRIYENESIKSIVPENISKSKGFESETFKKTGLKFVAIPDSVGFWGVNGFSERKSVSLVPCESEQAGAEKKSAARFISRPGESGRPSSYAAHPRQHATQGAQ